MEFTIEFGGDPQDVTITLSGVATPGSFRRFNEARLSDERFRKGLGDPAGCFVPRHVSDVRGHVPRGG